MKKQFLFIALSLIIFFKSPQPAKADFGLGWVAVGVVIGIVAEKIRHSSEESEEKEYAE